MGFIDFFGTVKVFAMLFSAILFNFVVKRAIGTHSLTLKLGDCEALPTRLLEGLSICPVQLQCCTLFSDRVAM